MTTTYITSADLTARFGESEMTRLAAIGSSLASVIADVNAEADAYVGASNTLPLPSTPASLAGALCDIARYRLYQDKAGEVVKDRNDAAVAFLRDVASGKVVLFQPVADPTDAGDGVAVWYSSSDPVFTRDTLQGL